VAISWDLWNDELAGLGRAWPGGSPNVIMEPALTAGVEVRRAEGTSDRGATWGLPPALGGPRLPETGKGRQTEGSRVGRPGRRASGVGLTGCELRKRQLDRMALQMGRWMRYLRAAWRVFSRIHVRAHSGHSVWRTSSNGEGSAWPCWRA